MRFCFSLLLFVCVLCFVADAQRTELPRLKKDVAVDTLQVVLQFDASISDTLQNAFRQSFIKATERFYRRSRSFVVAADSLSQHPSIVMAVGALRYPRPSGNYIALALNVVQLAGHVYWWHNSYSWFPLFWYFHPNTLAWISFSSESGLLRPSRHNAQPVDLIVSNAWFAGKELQHRRFARELEWTYYYHLRTFHRQNQRNKKRVNNR